MIPFQVSFQVCTKVCTYSLHSPVCIIVVHACVWRCAGQNVWCCIVQSRLTWALHSCLHSISAPFSASIHTRCPLTAAEEDMIEGKKMEMTFYQSTLLFKLYIYRTWVQVFDIWHALYVTESIKCLSYLAIQYNLIWQQLCIQFVFILHTLSLYNEQF